MSDETDPDTNDIDAFLRDDAIRNDASLSTGHNPDTGDTVPQPIPESRIQRLLARSAHADSNLRHAFTSILATQATLDLDSEACALLAQEMDRWERLLIELDEVCNVLLKASPQQTHSTTAARQEKDQTAETRDSLLAKIAAQDAQIRELKSRLERLTPAIARDLTPRDADASTEDSAANRTVNRLIIAVTDQGNLKFPLHKQIITIGRSPRNDIHIRSRFISRFHARIVCDQDEAIIEDLDSSNGINVNAQRASRQVLRSGDLIDLGRTQLRYIDLSEGSAGEGQA